MDRKVYLSNTPLSRAQEAFLEAALRREPGIEEIDTTAAAGRVTAAPVFARLSSPHYHASAMDGVAVRASDTFGVTPTSPGRLLLGENVFYVDTGGELPPGCDAVIMIEDVIFPNRDNAGVIEIREPATPWQHVRSIGEDIAAAEMILPSYHRIRPFDLGALLGGGIFNVKVLKEPAVAIIPTGSELVAPGAIPPPGKIIESNSYTFAAAVHAWGGRAVKYPIVEDEPEKLKESLEQAAHQSDLVLVSAGSSAGRKDHTLTALEALGEVIVHGVAMRPGKPVILGMIGTTPVMGVPGYPVAAYLSLELFVKPLLYHWQKRPLPPPNVLEAYSSRRVYSSLKENEFLRLKVGKVGERFVATPLPRGSGVTMSLVRADGITLIPQDKEGIEAGEKIEVELWRSREEIENTIVCLGSHDLSLDILSDLLKKEGGGITLSSAHVGSMGGIMALKRGETHIAGMHLLDQESGVYNIPYLRRYLPDLELVLVHLARRELGLFVAPGNRRRIFDIEDLCRDDVLFVNRQKGAGTRLYLDYMIKEKKLDPAWIKGYEREEFNHLAVAAAVAAGSADAGLGIRAAAEALGVDFIPLTQESYDLAMPAAFYQLPPCRALLGVISSPSFREAVQALGGYDLQECGSLVWQSHNK